MTDERADEFDPDPTVGVGHRRILPAAGVAKVGEERGRGREREGEGKGEGEGEGEREK